MASSEVKKEGLKWAFGALLAAAVVLASVVLIVKPMIERLVKGVEEQHGRLGEQRQAIAEQEKRVTELVGSLAAAEQELQLWKGRVGPLINDPALTAELRHALELLRDLPPQERNFLAAAARTVSGQISADTTTRGDGFVVTHDSVGQYTVTFDPPFAAEPSIAITVVASKQYPGGSNPHPADTTVNIKPGATRMMIWTYGINGDGHAEPQNASMSFMARGPHLKVQ
jgi:hypothetical protein